jgi:predicted transcriptional regulator YheO
MHVYSYTRFLKDSGKVTVLLCVNSDGSDKQVLIVIGKSPKP